MDKARENAKARRTHLEKKINELAQELDFARREKRRIDEFLKDWDFFSSDLAEEIDPTSFSRVFQGEPHAEIKKSNVILRNSKKEAVAEVARELIQKAGKPIMREDLFPLLRDRGLIIEGTDPLMVLSTMLWRMKDAAGIIRLKGGGYWLAERPYSPAKYFPEEVIHPVTKQKAYLDFADILDAPELSPVDNTPPENMEDDGSDDE